VSQKDTFFFYVHLASPSSLRSVPFVRPKKPGQNTRHGLQIRASYCELLEGKRTKDLFTLAHFLKFFNEAIELVNLLLNTWLTE
jgi:hypothetical protein